GTHARDERAVVQEVDHRDALPVLPEPRNQRAVRRRPLVPKSAPRSCRVCFANRLDEGFYQVSEVRPARLRTRRLPAHFQATRYELVDLLGVCENLCLPFELFCAHALHPYIP